MSIHASLRTVGWIVIGFVASVAWAETVLVQDGQPRAEIIIDESPPRTTRLAAQELQHYVKKISGANLEIVTSPRADVPYKVFVGQSPGTEARGIRAEDLQAGAYRIVSGDRWLVLIGDDTDFSPIEPWPRSNNDVAGGKMQRAWNEITGAHWGYPHSQLRKHYTGSTALFGTPNERLLDADGNVNVWGFDERGSFNAVCGLLRSLGVRWYLPGELGEVVPHSDSIVVPAMDETVRPDFPLRIVNFRFGVSDRDVAMWAMRLGVRQPYGRQAAHGLHHMTHNDFTRENHPEWFALYGGRRHTEPGQRLNQLCYSNKELFRETVRYVRAQFDHFDMQVVSVMPPDGYTAICQCGQCRGRATPERGYRGALSDYVWEFVNRVAKEVRQSHPDRMISNCAYGTYTEPPEQIEQLEPNLQVIVVGGRRPTSEAREEIRRLRKEWQEKTDNPLVIFENYPFTGRGFYLPAFIPRVLGESINATKGQSRGEDIWLTMDFGPDAVGFNHFLVYFTTRMYWGGKQQDVVQMFEEYCRLFYGPAAAEMKTFFEYCENHWREMESDHDAADQALRLFESARSTVEQGSIYARRIELIHRYLEGLRNKRAQLAQKRGPVPRLRLVGDPRGEIVIDGALDDEAWQKCPVASIGRLRELQTGHQPVFGTRFQSAWRNGDLYLAIRCDERRGYPLNVATDRSGDPAIWYGDVIEILLETDSHGYYQIAVNPAGAVVDLDRQAPKDGWYRWDSQAEVATRVADDHWIAEIRIPVVQDANDPLHQVIGRKPTQSLPWYINICRQRIREHGAEYSAFAPTGTASFHVPLKFAHFYAGRSHRFDADESVTDFLIASEAAERLMAERKFEPALDAFVALASSEATERQKSVALTKAAACARALGDVDRAGQLAKQIPIDAVSKTVQMENLVAERKWSELLERFSAEDLSKWPFWIAGEAAFLRARAHAARGDGKAAEQDLTLALELVSDARKQTAIRVQLGENREQRLQDDEGALAFFREVAMQTTGTGSADYYRGVQGAARVLVRLGDREDALETIRRVKSRDLRGHWRGAMLLSEAEVLSAIGRGEEAKEIYRDLADDPLATSGHRKEAGERISPPGNEN